jgi:chromosome segregation ATPase
MPVKLAVPDKLVESLKAVLLPELRHLKDEISDLRKESAAEFRLVHTEMKALDERLTGQMKALDDRLTGRMDALEEKLTSRVVMLEMKLGSRLDNVEVRLASLEDRFNVRMTALEEKVTTTTQIRERLAVLEDRLPRQ